MKLIYYVISFITILFFTFNVVCAEPAINNEKELIKVISSERDPLVRQNKIVQFLDDRDELTKFVLLPLLGVTCLENKDYFAAESYAKEMLKLAQLHEKHWNYGNAIHDGNMILGVKAFIDKNIILAKEYLILSGRAPKSPQLSVYGPYMILADALLDVGENDVVVDYLESLKKTWLYNDGRIDSWVASIKGGAKPHFGLNLPFKIIKSDK